MPTPTTPTAAEILQQIEETIRSITGISDVLQGSSKMIVHNASPLFIRVHSTRLWNAAMSNDATIRGWNKFVISTFERSVLTARPTEEITTTTIHQIEFEVLSLRPVLILTPASEADLAALEAWDQRNPGD